MDALLAQAQEHALLLALLLPVAFRLAGHWVPEEPLMVALGALAARAGGAEAGQILALTWCGHLATDHAVFSLGRAVVPRLARWPGISRRVTAIAAQVAGSPWALAAFIPARVLPLGRGIWLLGLGAAAVPRGRFLAVDSVALALHVAVWCGLGWWLGPYLVEVPGLARDAAAWAVAAAVCATLAVVLRRRLAGGVEPALGS